MPRVDGEGIGGGNVDDGIIVNDTKNANDQQKWIRSGRHQQRRSGSFGSWLGGAARSVSSGGTGQGGGGYIVLGGTRYGLRLSQESIAPDYRDSPNERSKDRSNQDATRESTVVQTEKDSSQERLTDEIGIESTTRKSMDSTMSLTADCCCIGTNRSRLPLPRNSPTLNYSTGSVGDDVGVVRASRSPLVPTKNDSSRLPPNSNANNNRGMLQTGSQQLTQPRHGSSSQQPRSAASSVVVVTRGSGVATNFAPVAHTVSSVPRQIAQWTKHQTLKLQEPAVTAVDRLHRFRWSGGGGGSGKKSSSGPRSEKAERLRELTEKLKGPAPIPPPRRPSRFQASSPTSSHQHHHHQHHSHGHDETNQQCFPLNSTERFCCDARSTSSSSSHGTDEKIVPKKLSRSESVGDEFYGIDGTSSTHDGLGEDTGDEVVSDSRFSSVTCVDSLSGVVKSCDGDVVQGVESNCSSRTNYSREKNFDNDVDELTIVKLIDSSCGDKNNFNIDTCNSNVGNSGEQQQILEHRNDSLSENSFDGSKRNVKNCLQRSENFDDNIAVDNRSGQTESRDALARLEPRGPLLNYHRTGIPFRSASFGQADLTQAVNRQRVEPMGTANRSTTLDGNKQVRASTLPRRRGDVGHVSSTTTRNSPRASTPSLDSAVGSAEGLGIVSQPVRQQIRPRSDGSDSLATSSALTSPEPPTNPGESHHQRLPPPPPPPPPLPLPLPPPPPPPPPLDSSQRRYRDGTPQPESIRAQNLDDQQVRRNDEHSTGRDNTASNSPRETWVEPHEVIITPPEEPRLSQTSDGSGPTSETPSPEALSPSGKIRRSRGDNSKRRKGVYITQWPEPLENDRGKLAAQSSEEREDPSITWSDFSDCEGHAPRRYSKRPLRGPYGQMLEAEMAKPRTTDIALEEGLRPRRKVSANLSFTGSTNSNNSETPTPCHYRTTSSPSKLESLPGPSPELLAELLRGSSERVACAPPHRNDTRNHVVVELYDTERSYVEALQILVTKYLQPLKSPENAGLVDSSTVNEIFYQVPAILSHHQVFLEELRRRLETWELHQTIGDIFLRVFTQPNVLETYTLFLDNWKSAEKAIKTTCQTKPAFARFLETLEREHKGKLGLDQLLIKPVQKIPRYELLIQRLLKHTDGSHPDYDLLSAAQKEIHELVVKINCTEREILEWEQQQSVLREVESLVEGLAGIVTKDRNVSPNSLAGLPEANKYKMLLRISLDDVEMIKAKEESLRRMAKEVEYLKEDCSTLNQLQELASTLHGTKHQLEELIKEYLGQVQRQLAEKNAAHSQLACLDLTLNTQNGVENMTIMFTKPETRASWEESFNDAKQKLDRRPPPEFVGPLPIRKTRAGLQFTCAAPTIATGQTPRDVWVCNSDGYVGQICVLSLTSEPPHVESCNGVCNARILCIAAIPAPRSSICDNRSFHRPCRSSGSSSSSRRRRRRRNLENLDNRPVDLTKTGISILVEDADANGQETQFDSSESSDDSDNEDATSIRISATTATMVTNNDPDLIVGSTLSAAELSGGDDRLDDDTPQPTVWLGTEDGCIHIYNCNDNIRIKKNRLKIQHGSSVHSIMYLDNKVFASLGNGDLAVYSCDNRYGWNTDNATIITVGTPAAPVTKMIIISGKLWCGSHNTVRIVDTTSLEIKHSFTVSNDVTRPISSMAASGKLGVWISLHNSAVLRLFHADSYECLTDINIAPAVTKMLASCDDIIRQHKAACLRVTALLSSNELLWVGTSAGVLLNIPIPHIKPSSQRMPQPPPVTGIPHGHTGHVRFLTSVEKPAPVCRGPIRTGEPEIRSKNKRNSEKLDKSRQNDDNNTGKLLIISGGDGYEDFRGPQATAELQAGREDSTNHLLLWKV